MRQLAARARARLTYGNVVATVALFIALGGTAWALARESVGAREIINGSVRSAELEDDDVRGVDIQAATISGSDVADDSLGGSDVRESSLTLPEGPPGPPGPPGADGSPDTPDQVIDKLLTVDGFNSGLDADTVDAIETTDLLRRSNFNTEAVARNPEFFAYLVRTTEEETFEFRAIELRTTGNTRELQVCSNGLNSAPIVRYVNGIRTVTTTASGSACNATFTPAAGTDFQIYGAGVMIWGVSTAIDFPGGDLFSVYGVDVG